MASGRIYCELVSQISQKVDAWMFTEFQKTQNFEASGGGSAPPIDGHLFSLLK